MAVKDNLYAREISDKGITYLQVPLVNGGNDEDHVTYINKSIDILFAICITNKGSKKGRLLLNGKNVAYTKEVFVDNTNYISIAKLTDLKIGDKITTKSNATFDPAHRFTSLIFLVEANKVTDYRNAHVPSEYEPHVLRPHNAFVNNLTVTGNNKTYYCIATTEYDEVYIPNPEDRIDISVKSSNNIYKEEIIYNHVKEQQPCIIIKKFTNLNKNDIISIKTDGYQVVEESVDYRGFAVFVEV